MPVSPQPKPFLTPPPPPPRRRAVPPPPPRSAPQRTKKSPVPPPPPPRPKPTPTTLTVVQPPAPPEEQSVATRPIKSHNFAFLSEEEAIPVQLDYVETNSLRRRHEFAAHVHELTCRVAVLRASLANEVMERHNSIIPILPGVYEPLERNLFGVDEKAPSWIGLEKKLTHLDSKMTKSVHTDLVSTQLQTLDRLLSEDMEDVQSNLRLETQKTDRREWTLLRNLEETVGTLTRRYRQEQATRTASTVLAMEQVKSLEVLDEQAAEDILQRIQKLKDQVDLERQQRLAEDELVRQAIAAKEKFIKEAILESIGEPVEEVERNVRFLEPVD